MFKSSTFSHFPNVTSGNCRRKGNRRCRKHRPPVDVTPHLSRRQDRGSEQAPSPPCVLPGFGLGAFLHTAALFLKQGQEQGPASPLLQWWQTPGDAATRTMCSEQQHSPNQSGWFGDDAAKWVQSITQSIPRCQACQAGNHAWVPSPGFPRNYSLMGAGLPANALTCFGAPFFLSKAFQFRLCTSLKSCSKATESHLGFHQNQVQQQPLLPVHGKGS